MEWATIGQISAITLAFLGTGSWIGWSVRGHDKRLRALEQEMPKKVDQGAHDKKRDTIVEGITVRVAALEEEMPQDLDQRLRDVEEGKLSIKGHAAICSTAMKTIEVQVAGIKELMNKQDERLQKGDELFIKLSELAGRMSQHLNNENKKGGT